MTVKDLVKVLKSYPDYFDVFIYSEEGTPYFIPDENCLDADYGEETVYIFDLEPVSLYFADNGVK